MFDFRYHALTLVAVFVSLAIGLLLGVAIGDQGLVSNAESDLRQNLRGDVNEARAQAGELRDQLAENQRYEDQAFPALVANRLDNRRIALVFVGGRDDSIFRGVRDAIAPSGGELTFVTTLRSKLDLEALGRLAAGTRYERLPDDPTLLDDLGQRIGEQLVTGGRLIGELKPELLESSNGELEALEGVVIARGPKADELDGEDVKRAEALVSGLIRGLRGARAPVVGAEVTATSPSQIPWYIEHGMASVDNLDHVAGRASLVFALAGSADGHYGVKPNADALLPDALARGSG